MSKENQIEEIIDVINDVDDNGYAYDNEGYEITGYANSRKIAEALYNAGYRKQSEWISVDDRLPACGELVLVSSMDLLTKKHGWFYLARYTDTTNNGVRFDDKRWVGEECGLFGRVTHWMPLPEAPKMKGGAE